MFLNTSLPIAGGHYFTADNRAEIYYKGGLVSDVWLIFIGTSIVNLVLVLVSPSFLLKFILRFWVWLKNLVGFLGPVYQEDANWVYEKNQFRLDEAQTELLLPIALALFYQPIMPIGSLFALGSTFALAWIHKAKFLWMSRSPLHQGSDVILSSLFILNMLPLAYGVAADHSGGHDHLRLFAFHLCQAFRLRVLLGRADRGALPALHPARQVGQNHQVGREVLQTAHRRRPD